MVRYKTGLKMSEKEVSLSLETIQRDESWLRISPVYQEGRLSNSSSRYRQVFSLNKIITLVSFLVFFFLFLGLLSLCLSHYLFMWMKRTLFIFLIFKVPEKETLSNVVKLCTSLKQSPHRGRVRIKIGLLTWTITPKSISHGE